MQSQFVNKKVKENLADNQLLTHGPSKHIFFGISRKVIAFRKFNHSIELADMHIRPMRYDKDIRIGQGFDNLEKIVDAIRIQ